MNGWRTVLTTTGRIGCAVLVIALLVVALGVYLSHGQTVPVGATCNVTASGLVCTTPPPPTFPVTLSITGTGAGTVTGAGSYAAGVLVQLGATPATGSVFAGWSPAPCASSFTMPATATACVATFTSSTPPPPVGAGTWTFVGRADPASGLWGPYFQHAAVNPVDGSFYIDWAWSQFKFTPDATGKFGNPANITAQVQYAVPCTNVNGPMVPCNLGSPENFGSAWWLSGGTTPLYVRGPAGYPNAQAPVEYNGKDVIFDPASKTWGVPALPGCVSNSAYAVHGNTEACFGGWSGDTALRTRTLPSGSWSVRVPMGNPPLASAGARATSWRGGVDRRTGTLYVLADGQELYTYDLAGTAPVWTLVPTTGPKPPEFAVAVLHETSNTLVAFVGCNSMVTGSCPAPTNQTYLLDLATRQWRLGPSGAEAPGAQVSAYMVPMYDPTRARVLLLRHWSGEPASQTGYQVWQWVPSATPPPPTFPVTLSTTGTGTGTVTGAGSYAAGAVVQLGAAPASGSVFAGWAPAPCAASFTMPAAALACVATFTSSTPPPTGFQFKPTPAVTTNGSPFPSGASSAAATKDVQWAWDSKRSRLIFGTGDFGSTYAPQSGQNTIYTYTAATDQWALLSSYCHAPGQLTPPHIQDRGGMAYDPVRDALWLVSLTAFPADTPGKPCTVSGPPGAPSGSTYGPIGLMRYTFATSQWDAPGPASLLQGESLGNAFVDRDTLIFFEASGQVPCVARGAASQLVVINLTTLTRVATYPLCNAPGPWASTGWVAPVQVSRTFFSFDRARRIVYAIATNDRFDFQTQTWVESRTFMFTLDLSTASPAWQTRAQAPVVGGNPYHIASVFRSDRGTVLWPLINTPCGKWESLNEYDPAANTWTPRALPTPTPHGSTVAFDEATGQVVTSGSVFCADFGDPYVQAGLWTYR